MQVKRLCAQFKKEKRDNLFGARLFGDLSAEGVDAAEVRVPQRGHNIHETLLQLNDLGLRGRELRED
jgi:hypothetical protein